MGIADDILNATVAELEDGWIDLDNTPASAELLGALSTAVASVMDSESHLDADGGWFTFPGGLMVQWGLYVCSTDVVQNFTFPTIFSEDCYGVWTNRQQQEVTYMLPVHSWSKTGFSINRNDGLDGSIDFNFLAIGK